MSGEPLSDEELARLFEAARFAPSAGNSQPWRFLYAPAKSAEFEQFFSFLNPRNQEWCVRAGALLVVISKTTFGADRPSPTHAFDTGAAWMSLALQGSRMGLVVHGLGGFDAEAARAGLGVPADHAIQCMVALGKPGRLEDLPESFRAREQPSERNPSSSFAFRGRFPRG